MVRWQHLFTYILLVRHLGFVCVLLYIAHPGLLHGGSGGIEKLVSDYCCRHFYSGPVNEKKKHKEPLILLSPPRIVRPTATLFVLIRDFSTFRCFIRGSNLLLVACKAHFNICHEFLRSQWRFSRRSIAVPSSTSTCSKSTWCWRRSGWQLEDLEAKMGQLLHNNRSTRPTGRLQVCYASESKLCAFLMA